MSSPEFGINPEQFETAEALDLVGKNQS